MSLTFALCSCLGFWQAGDWIGAGSKGNGELCGCQGSCFVSFPRLAEAPHTLSSKSKATSSASDRQRKDKHKERENGLGLVWSLRLWDSRTFSWTVTHFVCVCLPVCKDVSDCPCPCCRQCLQCDTAGVLSLVYEYMLKRRSPGSSYMLCMRVCVIPDQLYHHSIRLGSHCLMLA